MQIPTSRSYDTMAAGKSPKSANRTRHLPEGHGPCMSHNSLPFRLYAQPQHRSVSSDSLCNIFVNATCLDISPSRGQCVLIKNLLPGQPSVPASPNFLVVARIASQVAEPYRARLRLQHSWTSLAYQEASSVRRYLCQSVNRYTDPNHEHT